MKVSKTHCSVRIPLRARRGRFSVMKRLKQAKQCFFTNSAWHFAANLFSKFWSDVLKPKWVNSHRIRAVPLLHGCIALPISSFAMYKLFDELYIVIQLFLRLKTFAVQRACDFVTTAQKPCRPEVICRTSFLSLSASWRFNQGWTLTGVNVNRACQNVQHRFTNYAELSVAQPGRAKGSSPF